MTREVERTDDGRYVVVDGRRWRTADPALPDDVRARLLHHLGVARSGRADRGPGGGRGGRRGRPGAGAAGQDRAGGAGPRLVGAGRRRAAGALGGGAARAGGLTRRAGRADRDWTAMQTFLPVADFEDGARLLDSPRLGKQRVETLQILRALELPDYGWATHPAVRMWRGRTPALVAYGLAMVRVWRERGFADTTAHQIAEFAPEVAGVAQAELAAAGALPSWVGDEALHRSHRSNLLAKDPAFYRPRFAERFGARARRPALRLAGAGRRPAAAGTRGRAGLGGAAAGARRAGRLPDGRAWSGWAPSRGSTSTPPGSSPAELRALAKELSGRRPSKDLRQLSAFLDEMQPGDPVALPIEHGAGPAARRDRRGLPVPGARAAAAPPPGPVGPGRAAVGRPAAGHAAGPARAVLRRPRPGGARLAARRAASRSAAAPGRGRPACRPARVSSTCQSCCVRPCWIGSATTSIRPSVMARRKSVLLLTPTANWPCSSTAVLAPMLAADSTTEQ